MSIVVGDPEPCSGGTATCTSKAKCEVCRFEYGDYAPHTGGTATCTEKAVCEVCNQPYGEEPPGHDWQPGYDSTGHYQACSRCTAKKDEAGHTFEQQVQWSADRTSATSTITCACGYTDTDHSTYAGEEMDKHVEPTCTEPGSATYKATFVRLDHYSATITDVLPARGHAPGEPVRENQVPAQMGVAGSYDEVIYCTVCETELSREKKDIPALEPEPEPQQDSFTTFCAFLALDILNAPEGSVLEIDARQWFGLQWPVLEALAARPDVSLKLTCFVDGTFTELNIPAGFDLVSSLEPGQFLHFRELAKLLG